MTDAPAPNVSELAVAEIERRLQWRAMPALLFLGILTILLGVAFWPEIFPPRHVTGLPDDPDVFAAAATLREHVAPPSSELRFESALTGDVVPGVRVAADTDARLARAAQLLDQAHARLGRDVRLEVARAALDLLRHRYDEAGRRYFAALERAPNYPEARLGLGVAYALAGDVERNHLAQRQKFLRAIAQFACVTRHDAEYEEALYDRALLLDRVGRHAEAATFASDYVARGPLMGAERMQAIVVAGK